MERPHRNNIAFTAARNPDAIIAALAAFCLVYFGAPAVGLSPDSITYTSVARSLCATGRPVEFDGQWLMDFPLGYPAFLSLIMTVTRVDPFQFGLVLNGILFGILVFICLSGAKRNGFPLFLRCGYGLCLLFSTALLQVFGMLYSETLFILCVALFFLACGRYGRTHGAKGLWGMAAATALACVTRYIGVTLLCMGVLLLLTDRSLPWRKRVLHLFLYGAGGSSLLAVNLALNRVNQGYLTGDRLINHTPVLEHLQRFGSTLIQWVHIFRHDSPFLCILCAIAFIGAAFLGAWFLWWRTRSRYSWTALGALFTALYSIFLLVLATLTAFQPLDSRLLSPLVFPALGAAAGGILSIMRRLRERRSLMHHVYMPSPGPSQRSRTLPVAWAFIGLAVFILLFQSLVKEYSYLQHPEQVYQDHIRYDFSHYRQSPTLQFIDAHPGLFHSDKPIYSNAGEVLYVLCGLESEYLPRLDIPEEIRAFNDDTAYLVWINDLHVYQDDYLPGLRRSSSLAPLYSFPDGLIYAVLPVTGK